MTRDEDRIVSIRGALREANLDALAATLPANVLLLSGYWPVVGTSLALATRHGRVALLVPEDERALASDGWAEEVWTFKPGSLLKHDGQARASGGNARASTAGLAAAKCGSPRSPL